MFLVFKHVVNATLIQILKLRFDIPIVKLAIVKILLIFFTPGAFKLISVSLKP